VNSKSVWFLSQQISSRARQSRCPRSGAIVIRHQLAAADLAKHLALVGQACRTLAGAADEQIGGAAIDRHGVDVGLGFGAIDDGLVIAGDETLGLAEPRDP
jgi:hypothetical protein